MNEGVYQEGIMKTILEVIIVILALIVSWIAGEWLSKWFDNLPVDRE